jgi:tetratricopeptide (TPR) repeat protein
MSNLNFTNRPFHESWLWLPLVASDDGVPDVLDLLNQMSQSVDASVVGQIRDMIEAKYVLGTADLRAWPLLYQLYYWFHFGWSLGKRDHKRAFEAFKRCYDLLSKLPDLDPDTKGLVLRSYALASMEVENYVLAIVVFQQCITLLDTNEDLEKRYHGVRAGIYTQLGQSLAHLGPIYLPAAYAMSLDAITQFNLWTIIIAGEDYSSQQRQRGAEPLQIALLSPESIPPERRGASYPFLVEQHQRLLWLHAYILLWLGTLEGDTEDGLRSARLVACLGWLHNQAHDYSSLPAPTDPVEVQRGSSLELMQAIYRALPPEKQHNVQQSIRVRMMLIDILGVLAQMQIASLDLLIKDGKDALKEASDLADIVDPDEKNVTMRPLARLAGYTLDFADILATPKGAATNDTLTARLGHLANTISDDISTSEVLPNFGPFIGRLLLILGQVRLEIGQVEAAAREWQRARECFQKSGAAAHMLYLAHIDVLEGMLP